MFFIYIWICNVWVLDLFVFGYLDLLLVWILDLKPILKSAQKWPKTGLKFKLKSDYTTAGYLLNNR